MREDIHNRLNDKLINSGKLPLNNTLKKQVDLSSHNIDKEQFINLEEPIIYNEPSIMQTIISDNSKLAMLLLFSVSMYALYVLSKQNTK